MTDLWKKTDTPAFSNAKFEATGETKDWFGITLHRIRAVADIDSRGIVAGTLGGWIEKEDNLSISGDAWIWPDVIVCRTARIEAGTFRGGTFKGGTFWGGTFEGGTFKGGTFEGGTFKGGTFEGGTFWGGTFWGGWFLGGTFKGGTFLGGTFLGGTFEGGTFKGGTFLGGTFLGGTFKDGTFRAGTFRAGTFFFAITAQRSDGFVFTLNPLPDGPRIAAGCRYFTFKEARKHWQRRRGGTPLGEETFAILGLLEAQARIHGFDKLVGENPA